MRISNNVKATNISNLMFKVGSSRLIGAFVGCDQTTISASMRKSDVYLINYTYLITSTNKLLDIEESVESCIREGLITGKPKNLVVINKKDRTFCSCRSLTSLGEIVNLSIFQRSRILKGGYHEKWEIRTVLDFTKEFERLKDITSDILADKKIWRTL